MTTSYIIGLLRGINVGGHHKIKMAELIDICQKHTLSNIKTYIQSGNIIFKTNAPSLTVLAEDLSESIQQLKGFKPHILLIPQADFQHMIQNNPFKFLLSQPKHGHLFFFDSPLKENPLEKINALLSPTERILLDTHVLYLYAPDGIGRSKLVSKLESLLGTPTTARNWNTVLNIESLLEIEK